MGASGTAPHLFRIAQEGVRNAVRHGKARRIQIVLSHEGGDIALRVRDDGVGVPRAQPSNQGLGLRIMAHRAMIIGASIAIESPPDGGTLIVCRLPQPDQAP